MKSSEQLANQILSIWDRPKATKVKNSKDGFCYYFSKDSDISVGLSKQKHKHGYEYVVCLKEDHDEVIDMGFIDRKGRIFKTERRIDLDTSKKRRFLNWALLLTVKSSVYLAASIKWGAEKYIELVVNSINKRNALKTN